MLSATKGQSIFYDIGQFRYEFVIDPYNAHQGTQRNTVTNRIRHCRKISTAYSVHQGLTLKKMLDSSWNDKYPSWWFDKSAELHNADVVDWPLDNEICKEIKDIFDQTGQGYKINSIFSIQNKFLWKHYQFLREIHSEALGTFVLPFYVSVFILLFYCFYFLEITLIFFKYIQGKII